METYYTHFNLLVYAISCLILLVLLSLAVLLQEGKWPVPIKKTIWMFIVAVALFPLSYSCPFPLIQVILRYCSFGLFLLGLLMSAVFTLLFYSKKRSLNVLPMNPMEADRWINHALRGTYLVSDPLGNIIGGNLKKCPLIPETIDPGLTLVGFIKQLEDHIPDREQYENLLDACPGFKEGNLQSERSWKSVSGKMELLEGYYNWSVSPLGEEETEGYLFSLKDLSEEFRLYKEREKQEQLMTLRMHQLKYQAEETTEFIQDKRATETIQQSTEVLKQGLGELMPVLTQLPEVSPQTHPYKWQQALELSAETMKELRKTIHEMDSHWRKS